MNPGELKELLSNVPGLQGVHQVHNFVAHRECANHGDQTIKIEVWDRGEGVPLRYSVVAKRDDGKQASGNSHESLQAAIAMVHWGELDK